MSTANPRHKKILSVAHRVSKELWAKEAKLLSSKWYDYRMDDPVTATEKFAEAYIYAFRFYHKKLIDTLTVDQKEPIKSCKLEELPDTDVTALWKARQEADRLGVPYKSYTMKAFSTLMERQYKKLPRPNQLYSPPVLEAISAFRELHSFPGILCCEDERYLSENQRGAPAQIDLANDIIRKFGDTEKISLNEYNLARAVYELGLLPEDQAQKTLDPKVLAAARKSATDNGIEPTIGNEKFSEFDFDNCCFGVPHIEVTNEANCSNCNMQTSCEGLRDEIKSELLRQHGSLDPKNERKKELGRKRKQKQRERERQQTKTSGVVETQ